MFICKSFWELVWICKNLFDRTVCFRVDMQCGLVCGARLHFTTETTQLLSLTCIYSSRHKKLPHLLFTALQKQQHMWGAQAQTKPGSDCQTFDAHNSMSHPVPSPINSCPANNVVPSVKLQVGKFWWICCVFVFVYVFVFARIQDQGVEAASGWLQIWWEPLNIQAGPMKRPKKVDCQPDHKGKSKTVVDFTR